MKKTKLWKKISNMEGPICKLRKVIETWLSKKDDKQVKYLSGKKK